MKREVFIGNVGVGGNHPVSIQSMTSTSTGDAAATLEQITRLASAGCEIVRVALPDRESIGGFEEVVNSSPLPVVADIHFSAELALKAIELGASCIRINPGNIGSDDRVRQIVNAAGDKGIPIRIGVNMGSIEKKYWNYPGSRAEVMVKSVMDKVALFEEMGFQDIKLSLKSSDVVETVEAYRLINKMCEYPLHLGVTETGTFFGGSIRSAIGIGALLLDGIGNTLRVSLTDDPVQEIKVAKEILNTLGLRRKGITLVACPTCSRTSVELIQKVNEFEQKTENLITKTPLKVAIMGCEVNGPGEARDADIGLAFSREKGYIFVKGEMKEKVEPSHAINRLIELIKERVVN